MDINGQKKTGHFLIDLLLLIERMKYEITASKYDYDYMRLRRGLNSLSLQFNFTKFPGLPD